MQRNEIDTSGDDKGRIPSLGVRVIRRVRTSVRLGLRKLHQMRAALAFAGLLASVGIAMFSPLLLDDLAFRASYLLRPSQDAMVISEPIVISEQPRMTVVSGTLSVPPALSGQARTGEALAALVKGGSARLALKQPVIHLELSPQITDEVGSEADWRPNLDLPFNAPSPLMTALEDSAFETLSVRDGTILLKSAGRTDTLEEVSADITVKRKTAVRLKGSFKYAGETLTIDATLGARIGRGGGARMPMRAQVQSSLFSIAADGRLDLSEGLQIVSPITEVSIPNIRAVARWLGHVWPSGPGLKNFVARGSAIWTGQTISFQKGTFEIDGNAGNGALSLTMDGPRPALAGTLAFQAADLGPYLASDDGAQAAASTSAPLPNKSLLFHIKAARDLALPLIGAVDADLRMSADTVTAGPLVLGRSAASLALRDRRLLLNLADVALPSGGTVELEIGIDGRGSIPDYDLHGRMQGVELADVTTLIAGTPMLRGRGGLQFDFTAGGRSGMDALTRLNGMISLDMPKGGPATCSLGELSALATVDVIDGCRTTTALGPLKASARTHNGVLAFDKLELMSGSNQILLDGTVDLVTSVLHLNLSARAPPNAISVAGEAPMETIPARDVIAVRGRPNEVKITVRGK